MNTTKRVLIFSSAETEYAVGINDVFIQTLNERLGSEVTLQWHNFQDIRLEFGTDSFEAYLQSTGESLSEFQFVYFKSYFRYSEQAAVIGAYLDAKAVPFVCSEIRDYMSITKLTQFGRMATAGIPIIKTVYLHASRYLDYYEKMRQTLGTPFIFKSIDGSGGRENYLISKKQELEAALQEFPDLQFVAQEFIENDSDLRVLILGKEIQMVIHRRRVGDSHMNNTSQGGAATLVPLEELAPEHQALALKAADVMKRETAGVDLMFETGSGKPYILEVNASPQVGSGAYMEEKLEIYCNYFKNVLK